MDVILLCLVTAGRSFFLSFFLVFFVLLHIHVLIFCTAPDGILIVKEKTEAKTRTHVKQKNEKDGGKERESARKRANDVSWTFVYTYVLQKSVCFSIHSSFFLSHVCFFFFGTFLPSFSRSPVLLVVVVLIVIRRYQNRNVFCLFHVFYIALCVSALVMGEERKRERERARARR